MACIALALACDGSREVATNAASSAPSAPLAGVEFAGCSVIEHGARCELSAERRLTFWLPTPHVLESLRGDDQKLQVPRPVRADEGQRYELPVPAGVRRLQLRDAAGARFVLELAEPLSAPELEHAKRLRQSGEFTAARALLTAALPKLSPVLQRRAEALLARLSLAEGHHAAAADALQRSMDAAFEAGRIGEGLYDATALAFVLSTNVRSYSRAREVLAQAARYARLDPMGAALLPHYAGVLALETGDLQAALGSFRASARRAGRLGLREHELLAHEQEASTLALLGRYAEAVASQRKVVDEFPRQDACQRADRSESVVWFGLMAEAAPGSELARVIAAYAARSARELEACPSPWRKRNHQINAALFALQHGQTARAGALLAALAEPSALNDPVLDTWERELRGRYALLTGRPRQALAYFRGALERSELAGLWDNRQLAQLGSARALERLGETQAALGAYEAAERSLDSSLASVPLSEGQAGFRGAREAGTQERIRLLLRTRAPARAFEVARSARARRSAALAAAERARSLPEHARERWEAALSRYQDRRTLAEQLAGEAWQVPADQLPEHQRQLVRRRREAHEALDEAYASLRGGREAGDALQLTAAEPHELVLGLFPDGERLVVFLEAGGRTRSHTLQMFDVAHVPGDLGDRLLGEYASELGTAARLRVIAHPSLGGLDLHGASLQGAPLLERFAIRYGTDTPASSPVAAPSGGLLIVIDPRGDLRAAQAELQLVAPERSASVRTLFGAEARRAELLSRLPSTALFHYAGHYRFAGIEGTDSALLLADGELSVGDVLTLPRGPARVVLATCEGARYEGPGFSGGLGMAQAFIAIGASEVVAASRPIPDADARELTGALYASQRAAPAIDLTEALRRAQLQIAARAPAVDWRAFRALGR